MGVGETQITLSLGNPKSSWENESFIVFLVKPFLVVEGQPIGAKIRSVLFPGQSCSKGNHLNIGAKTVITLFNGNMVRSVSDEIQNF